MHMFDAVWKLGHPTPHREQKKTSPKKTGRKKEKKTHTEGLEGTIYRNFSIF